MRKAFWNVRVGLRPETLPGGSMLRLVIGKNGRPMAYLVMAILLTAALGLCQAGEGIVASLRVPAPKVDSYYWIVAQEYQGLDFVTEMRFYLRSPKERKQIYAYRSSVHLMYMFLVTTADNHLITVWETGSGVAVTIFELEGDTVKVVFEDGAPVAPEVLWGVGGRTVLLSGGKIFTSEDNSYRLKETKIFAWDGKEYKLRATVPFERRYEALAKLYSERKK